MKKIWKCAFVVFALCFLSFTAIAQKGIVKMKSKPQPKKVASTKPTSAATTLEEIVAPFALPIDSEDKESAWKCADEAVGVRWVDKAPREDTKIYVRAGTANLLSDSSADVNYYGNQTTVSNIEIDINAKNQKLFGSEQLLPILREQFGVKASVRLIHSEYGTYVCEILFESKKPIYVRMYADFGGTREHYEQYSFRFSQQAETN